MNEADEMRQLFDRAASEPVDVDRVDPDAIVRAGKRGVARKQVGTAAAGVAAAMLAVGAAVGIPMTLGGNGEPAGSGAAPDDLPTVPAEDAFLDQWARADHGDCPVPEGQTEEQRRTAAAYNQTVFQALAEFGAEPLGKCLTTRPDHDGFYFDDEQGAYYMEESVAFGDDAASDWARVTGAVWETEGVDYEEQMEMEECTGREGLTCSWEDTDAGRVLLIEGTRDDFLNPDTEAGGSAEFPVVSAFLFRDDVVVSLAFSLHFESGQTGPSIDQVVDLATAIPVDQEAPEAETPAWADVADELAAAAEHAIPGVAVETGTADFVRLHPAVAEYGGPVYGSDTTHMVFVLAELDSGETVRLFLQAEPVEDAGEDPTETAASLAQCPLATCETASDGPNISVHRTIEDERRSLTALEYRPGDGWMIGIGVETVDGTAPPPVDFETLDAIVDAIR
jgi:hypothetical protein